MIDHPAYAQLRHELETMLRRGRQTADEMRKLAGPHAIPEIEEVSTEIDAALAKLLGDDHGDD